MKKTVSTISPILELKHKWDVVLELSLIVAILSAVPSTFAQATLEGINSTLAQTTVAGFNSSPVQAAVDGFDSTIAQEVVTKQATTPAPPTQPPIPSQWLTHQALTSVPPSPANASIIQLYYLDYNSITSINPQTNFANYSRLYGLFITNNYLTELPCLPNIKTTLSQLYLNNNLISYIPPACLSLLQYLSSLILYNNRISHLPDVYMANIYNIGLYTNAFTTFPTLPILGRNLRELSLSYNQISEVSVSDINLLTNLVNLNLQNNLLTTLPNWCNRRPGKLYVDHNPLVCDCRLRWLYGISDGLHVYTSACAGPPSLAGQQLSNLTGSQLTCSVNGTVTAQTGSYARMSVANFRCTNPPIAARMPVSSVGECATLCFSQPHCTSFNLGTRTNTTGPTVNNLYCDVSGVVDPNLNLTSAGATKWSWFMLL